jgi:hypothetical protein
MPFFFRELVYVSYVYKLGIPELGVLYKDKRYIRGKPVKKRTGCVSPCSIFFSKKGIVMLVCQLNRVGSYQSHCAIYTAYNGTLHLTITYILLFYPFVPF